MTEVIDFKTRKKKKNKVMNAKFDVDRINEMDLNIQYIYRRVKELEKKEQEKSNNGGWIFS